MTANAYLSIASIRRRLAAGNIEELEFGSGVNVLVGPPNAGKTKWLQSLDFLLGDPDENPFEGAEEAGLSEKYDAVSADLIIGEKSYLVERRWREKGAKTKIFMNDDPLSPKEFQNWLMEKLAIPLLNFPKGNPMSGQTWPELSFRMLLRHIYRQQRFWGDIADKQPEGEQHACILQFLGLAERIFTDEYGRLVNLKLESDRLKSRREQYNHTLAEVARDVLSEPGLTVGVSAATVKAADERISNEISSLRHERIALLTSARDRTIPLDRRGRLADLARLRAESLAALEQLRRGDKDVSERLADLLRYRSELANELDRLNRAEDAGLVLSDLKITHCPACDQSIASLRRGENECFLCHQHIAEEVLTENLGAVRLRFETDRLTGELKEADDLIEVLKRDALGITKKIAVAEERLRMVENELAPARDEVSALAQDDVSAIDMALGEANERQRQISRIAAALDVGEELTERVRAIEKEIRPLQESVDEAVRATDFDAATRDLEDGINAYLASINKLRSGAWRHSLVRVESTRSATTIRVGSRRWSAVLGGTDTLYFLMAYHYGLLSLSAKAGRHYPGLSIIDVPGEFAGEEVRDKENFIVQPFIDLLSSKEYKGAQLIITGASFAGLEHVHRRELRHIYVAS